MREALFNLVGPVDDATVLDLYAGSGALGLEALSRGARRCVFAEADGAACARHPLEPRDTRPHGCARPAARRARGRPRGDRRAVVTTTSSCSTRRTTAGRRSSDGWRESLPAVLAGSGLVVVETDARVEPELPLDLVTTRRYGSARLSVFTHP